MRPTGASALDGAQLILLGSSIEAPAGYRARAAATTDPYALAASVAKLLAIARGTSPRQVIVVDADGPPALAMPAAGLSAQTGAPILFVTPAGVPAATATELRSLGTARDLHGRVDRDRRSLRSPSFSASERSSASRPAPVKTPPPPATRSPSRASPTARSAGASAKRATVSRSSTRRARSTRPPPRSLSATGDYAPLLLLEDATGVPSPLSHYLSDIQPAAPHSQPVKGVYNHGWLIGDERAISATTQAELDAMLQIVPQSSPSGNPPACPSNDITIHPTFQR